jgi:nuclear transport factor 2 (NTF2) superfamily protein
MDRPPFPPFTTDTAIQKVRLAEDAWNMRNPDTIVATYSDLLTRKWKREHNYRLIKELWAVAENRISVRFAYEWQKVEGNWFRSYGNENWEFAPNGRMSQRHASINDLPITANDRLFHWPLGRRPDDHLGLTDLNL